MPRLPYQPADLAEPKDVVDAIRKRRGGHLANLDRILLYSPDLASGWNTFLGGMRARMELDARLRELAMCGVAVLNRAEYEMFHHAPVLLAAGGTQAQIDALRRLPQSVDDAVFNPTERAALRLTVEMTRNVEVSDATFDEARRLIGNDKHMFELIATIAAYNMVSRILVATGIEPE